MVVGILMDTPRVRAYLESISGGFNKNPGDIIASIAGVVGLFFVLFFVGLWWRKKEDLKRKEKTESAFFSIAGRLKLTLSEIELLNRLSDFVPGGKNSLPGLVKHQQQFNIAAKKALKKKAIGESEIASLRFRLGHINSNTRGILSSTAFLKSGTAVEVIKGDMNSYYGSVAEVTPGKFTVKVLSDATVSGMVELRFARPTGIYSCRLRVVRHHNDIAEFRHTEAIKRIQKRSSLRKRIAMTIVITIGEETYRGKLIDLSEGGARIYCSGTEFHQQQNIKITLFQRTDVPVSAAAKVIRAENESNYIGVEFQTIDEKLRERIANTVFH